MKERKVKIIDDFVSMKARKVLFYFTVNYHFCVI